MGTRKILLSALLVLTGLFTMSLVDYQLWSSFRGNVSIMKGSAKKPNDSLMLEIGASLDTNKQGVRLGPITQDTGRAYKVKGSIVWQRTNNAYYHYNGTKWVASNTLAQITAAGTAGIASTTDTVSFGAVSTNGGIDRWQFLGYETGSGGKRYLKVIYNGTTYWTEVFSTLP